MEVLGISKQNYEVDYICRVTHKELKNFLNVYYTKKNRDLETLTVGDIIDLSKGYNFYHETKQALDSTQALIKSNKSVLEAIFNGIQIMGNTDSNIELPQQN